MKRITSLGDLMTLGAFVFFGANWAGRALLTRLVALSGRFPAAVVDSYRDGQVAGLPIRRPEAVLAAGLAPTTAIVIVSRRQDEIAARLAQWGLTNVYSAIDYAEMIAGTVVVQVSDAARRALAAAETPRGPMIARTLSVTSHAVPDRVAIEAQWRLDAVISRVFADDPDWTEPANAALVEDGVAMLRPTAPHLSPVPPVLPTASADAVNAEALAHGLTPLPITVAEEDCLRGPRSAGVAISTMPKSGSLWLGATLARLTGRQTLWLPDSRRFPRSLRALCRLGIATATPCLGHVDPTEQSARQLLEAGIDRIHVHVRDPVAAAWSHLLWKRDGAGMNRLQRAGRVFVPAANAQAGLSQCDQRRLVALAEHKANWIDAWRALARDSRLAVSFGGYREAVSDLPAYMARVLRHFGLAIEEDAAVAAPVPIRNVDNFRSGDDQEWRRFVPPEVRVSLDRLAADLGGT